MRQGRSAMAMGVLAAAVLFTAGGAVRAATGEKLGEITVEAGEHDRLDAVVHIELPAEVNAWRPLRLTETTGDRPEPTPSQVEAGRDGEPARLWFVLDGETPAGQTRRFELHYGEPVGGEAVTMTLTPRTLEAALHGEHAFTYNHAHVPPPEGIGPEFIRSGYIHPVHSPAGRLVTEDFPSDHHHHKGIWSPWTNTEFEGRAIDFWNLGQGRGTVQFAGFEAVESGAVFGGFRAKHEFVDLTQEGGGKVALDEVWDVRLWAAGGSRSDRDWWAFDLTSTQEVRDSPLKLLEYHYGGMGFRGAAEWDGDNYVLLTSEGRGKEDGHETRAKWCAHSGRVDGEWATVVIMCHPDNERFPEPMRIWESGGAFFCYSPVQAGEWTFEPGETHRFAYRYFIYDGEIDAERIEQAWHAFANPPAASFGPAE